MSAVNVLQTEISDDFIVCDIDSDSSLPKNDTVHPGNIEILKIDSKLYLNEITNYILELEFGDQTQDVDATKILRNLNFVIACNIWLFVHDENDEDNEWNVMLPLKDTEKEMASTDLNKSNHSYKAIKYKTMMNMKNTYKILSNNCVINAVKRIPDGIYIGAQAGIEQSVCSGQGILIGSVLILVENMKRTNSVLESETSTEFVTKAATLPLCGCVSLVAAALGGTMAIAAIPVQTFGTAGLYICNGTQQNNSIYTHHFDETVGRALQLFECIDDSDIDYD